VPTPDFDSERDDRFEAYLKQFRPLAIEPLQIETSRRAVRRSFRLAAWAASAAAVILVGWLLAMHPRAGRTESRIGQGDLPPGAHSAASQPLTIGSANTLLAHAPSVKAALDLVPFHPPSTQLPKGQRSALAVLSEEKDKL
jgi:hypothetical protein